MDMQITYTAQYGLEWRVVLTDRPASRHADTAPVFELDDDLPGDDSQTQEAAPLTDLKPRVYTVNR